MSVFMGQPGAPGILAVEHSGSFTTCMDLELVEFMPVLAALMPSWPWNMDSDSLLCFRGRGSKGPPLREHAERRIVDERVKNVAAVMML
jgi:hypothetical protein